MAGLPLKISGRNYASANAMENELVSLFVEDIEETVS